MSDLLVSGDFCEKVKGPDRFQCTLRILETPYADLPCFFAFPVSKESGDEDGIEIEWEVGRAFGDGVEMKMW